MDSKQWQKVKSVFDQIVDMPMDRRRNELLSLTESDVAIRKEVESLLEFDSQKQVICSASTPLEGNTSGAIVGPFRLNFPLAINDQTEVWQATEVNRSDDATNKKVAVKFLKDMTGDSRRERRFRQEAAILARFDHPGIAKFREEGITTNDIPWFATSYVEGQDIITAADRRALNLEQRLSLFDQVLAAVEYSHRFLVVHRDLKPSNIVVDDDHAVLIDFGISKQIESLPMDEEYITRTYERTLTPAYASPEQLRGEPVSALTDVYGAGLVLYELVCGHHPYSDVVHHIQKPLFDRILTEMPLAPSRTFGLKSNGLVAIGSESPSSGLDQRFSDSRSFLKSKLANGLDQIIMRALEKDPSNRYASVSEFRKAVADFAQGKKASNGSVGVKRASWLQRHIVASMLISALAGGLILFAIQGLLRSDDSTTSQNIEQLKAKVEFLTLLNEPKLDFSRIAALNLSDFSPAEKLALLEKLTTQGEFAEALEIASSLTESSNESLSIQSKFKLAQQLNVMGKPKEALRVLEMTPEKFETAVLEHPSIESSRPLLCRLFIANGSPSLARVTNLNGPNESKIQQFERELSECEIREADLWFDGLKEKIDALDKSVSSLSLEDSTSRRYSVLRNRFSANVSILRDAILGSRTEQRSWQRSELQLVLAKRLLEDNKRTEATSILAELVDRFSEHGLPTHPIALRALITADKHKISEIDISSWWNANWKDVELGTTDSFDLLAAVVNRNQDAHKDLPVLIPFLDLLEQQENASTKVNLVRAIWLAAVGYSDVAVAEQLARILDTSANEILDADSVEYLESQMIVSTILRSCSVQNPIEEMEKFTACKTILQNAIEQNDDNISTVFLMATDTTSPSSFFRGKQSQIGKSSAEWVREFMYHRYNQPSDQLEMVAFFSEDQAECNPDDVRRMLATIESLRAEVDWGPKGDSNWRRIESVKTRLSNNSISSMQK